ncbi:Undecaprenyl-phosphate 4-deoxy-4-formamido-L-arabinose transferase [Corynebacterium occultum]|uniref:4,4'-diaponeurosporenoate glycosyltransferase n=1 Tax=Corynebacterium occultum TaxID=2675219 RepID=A0A6B8W7X2_9CORY|nr:glycosyltransferase family A protein [Corynebacterium occultum]QGU06050.1 Undecaprenyl-phosphate 4-deoxy-4-formamido-L-arabinose transferase [Corynebacterium occultum]
MRTSIVIPVWNDALILDVCLKKIAAQDTFPEEVIIVDNGSEDNLAEVVRLYPELNMKILKEPRKGIPFAVVAGYDAAAGEMILRCDADSRVPPDWITRHHRTLTQAGPEVVAVSGVPHFGDRSTWWGTLAALGYINLYRGVAGIFLHHPALWGSNMALRRSWWLEVREGVHLSPRVHDDFDLSFRLREGEKILIDRHSVVQVSWRALSSPRRWWRQAVLAWGTIRANR